MAGDIRIAFNGFGFAAVYDDAIADVLPALGPVTVTRASHVEPHDGGWIADMRPSNGPVLMAAGSRPFALRADALNAERAWLRETWGL